MSDQNSPVAVAADHDPEALLRENATLRERLTALQTQNVINGRFAGEAPRYRLNDKGYYDDTLFEAGSVIEWTDAPNLTMVPLNDAARHRMQEEIIRQTDGARAVAARTGREFIGLVNDRNVLLDNLMSDARRQAKVLVPVIKMPEVRDAVPQMPHVDQTEVQRRGPGRPRRAVQIAQPAPARDLGAPMLAPTNNLEPAIVGRMVG